jgi:hypothetical protein
MNCIIVFLIVVVGKKDNTKRLNETSGHGLIGCKCSQLKVKYMLKVYVKKHTLNNRGG